MVYPYISYCNLAWASTYPTRIKQIFILQKRVIRIISQTDYLAHTTPLFQKLNLLNIYSLNSFQAACFVHDCLNNRLPACFNNFFLINKNLHNYNTRISNNLHIFPARTTLRKHSIKYRGPKIWNSLETEIKNINTYMFLNTHLVKAY